MKSFYIIWLGQLFSQMGTGLTGFALGVWAYQRNQSATQFALIVLASEVPGILMSPIAGALVDRWNRRTAMLISDLGAAVCTAIIGVLAFFDQLELWNIFILMALSSVFTSFQWPAYGAAISQIVPKDKLGRAAGMSQFSESLANLASPILGGVLVTWMGLTGVITIDLSTFAIAVVTLLMVSIPKVKRSEDADAQEGGLIKESFAGWDFVRQRPGLSALLGYFLFTNLLAGMVSVLMTPLVLAVSNPTMLGMVMSVGGVGMMAGSALLGAWGGPRNRMVGIFAFQALSAVGLFLAGVNDSPWIIAAGFFLSYFATPIVLGCSQIIWQSKVPQDLQGRVFALRTMIAWSSLPVAYLIAGPLADNVFEPAMRDGGAWAATFGPIIGTGPGRGMGLLFLLMSSALLVSTGIASLVPRLRHLESEIPDIPDEDDANVLPVNAEPSPS